MMRYIRYLCICFMTIVIGFNPVYTYGQTKTEPLFYWTFDEADQLKDSRSASVINTRNYKCNFEPVKSLVGTGARFSNPSCLAITQALHKNVTNEFSIELLFKGDELFFTTFSGGELIIRFDYPRLQFRTSITSKGKVVHEDWTITLDGTGRRSYNYYTDGQWHHLVFTASTKTGVKQIWVDGELEQQFEKKISKGVLFAFSTSDAFKGNTVVDEVAIYNKVLTPAQIMQHFREVHEGKHYSFTARPALPLSAKSRQQATERPDPYDFAPGYPNYTVQAYEQLKAFPLPRYKQGVHMKRLVPWFDITYFHRELPTAGGKGFGVSNAEKAVAISRELAANWNYYVDLPLLYTTEKAADEAYTKKGSVHRELINFVNNNPQFPYSTILLQVAVRPSYAGFERKTAYVTAQDLPDKYYLRNAAGKPVVYNGKKWLSPLMPLDIIEKDGKTSLFHLRQLLKHVNRPPALINENGEHFGHMRPEKLLQQDPKVYQHFKNSGLTLAQYSGMFQYRLDSTYKASIMQGMKGSNTRFSFYNVSAIQPAYWPDYAMRRKVNAWDDRTIYSSPDFYPRYPNNWRTGQGSNNGYGNIAYGRATEIKLGDKLFSPFVSAGWGEEEKNIRPAQWLSLLKAMVMLGADFFYVGYFNVTGAGGKWPNGSGPYDPRGYAYQVAMPAYAQAMASHIRDFIAEGELLNPATPNDQANQFRFKGKAENELILVRKLGKKYLIYGSIQPNSNLKGNVPDETITQINLEGRELRFAIRRQGSVYVLDLSRSTPVMYQIDGWHEHKHPWYWQKATEIEAEMPDNHVFADNIRNDKLEGDAWDFSNMVAYFNFNSNNLRPDYVFRTRNTGAQYCFVRARVRNGKEATLKVLVDGEESNAGFVTITGSGWNWYPVKITDKNKPLTIYCNEDKPVTIRLQTVSGNPDVDVDKFRLQDDDSRIPEND